MRLTVNQIAQFTAGKLIDPVDSERIVEGLTWDSRTVTPGCLYVAFPGERVDGHSFVDSAVRAGAAAVLVMHELPENDYESAQRAGTAVIQVADTFAAVTNLARAWRGFLRGTVIGVTGSSGKTTTKNLIRDVLASTFDVVATQANQNNELGVPRTLLNAQEDTEFVVVEMGMRGLGQIQELCSFAKPDQGVIVSVGESHIELLGGRDNIARAKSELFQALPNETGTAFVNESDDYAAFVQECAHLSERRVDTVLFGVVDDAPACDRAVFAQGVQLDLQGRPTFQLTAYGFDGPESCVSEKITLNLRGAHNASNATAAAAIGLANGVPFDSVIAALCAAEPESGRQEVIQAPGGYTVVNDAYNANPESMKASLTMFAAMETAGKRVAVLSDMAELGDYGPGCHTEVGELIASLNIDTLICFGGLSTYIAQAALANGMAQSKIVEVNSVDDALAAARSVLNPGDMVLVKASHCMGLLNVVEGLIQ